MEPDTSPSRRSRVVSVSALAAAVRLEPGEACPAPEWPSVPGYRILSLIGEGGAGQVFRAVRVGGSQMPIALKVLRQAMGREGRTIDRVWRELDILSELRLACVPRLLDWGMCQGRLYIATELVEGLPLDEHCARAELGLRDRVTLLVAVCEAVSRMHDALVIHRDLKPSNILVDTHGRPMIVDFGVARLTSDEPGRTVTETGAAIGTTPFIAPEVARGDPGGLRSLSADLYSLGATTYVVITGHPPREERTSTLERLKEAAEGQTRDPRSLRPDVPKALAAVLRKSCSREPGQRYASAREFGDDLHRWLEGEPVRARSSRWMRGTEWVGRHPVWTTSLLCAAIAGASVASVVTFMKWYMRQPDQVVSDPLNASVQVLSRAGLPVAVWSKQTADSVVFAGTARTGHGDAKVGVLALRLVDDPRTEQLSLFELDNLNSPFWQSGTKAPHFVAPSGARESDSYRVRWVGIADVFPADPGDEIVAIFNEQSNEQSCIRVYNTKGDVLYETWHRGRLKSAHWLKDKRTLMVAGVTNRKDVMSAVDRAVGSHGPCLPIVFALHPRRDDLVRWIESDAAGGGALAWYRFMGPLKACAVLNDPTVEASIDPTDRGSSVRLILSSVNGPGNVAWTVHWDGSFDRCKPSQYYQGMPGAMPAEDLSWTPRVDVPAERPLDASDSRSKSP